MKILVLAGGADQIALIKELKWRGPITIIIDYFQNPPAKNYANKHIVASTLDIEKVKEIAITEQVGLICTACTDQALLTVAKVSEDLGLPCYIDYKTALNVTNKAFMKSVMVANDIPTAKYTILHECCLKDLSNFEYPLVVKPVDCNSSKGVKKVEDEESLRSSLNNAVNYSRTHTAIVEEFICGDEISADFYIENSKAKYLCATKSVKRKNTNSFTIVQSVYPVVNYEEEVQLTQIAQKITDAFHLQNTPLLVQLLHRQNDFLVVEFSARMGGGSKYRLIETLSGVNIMSKYVDLILGHSPSVSPSKQVNYAVVNYVYSKPGILKQVDGLDSLKNKSVIDDFFYYKTAGMQIDKAETSGDRVIGYLVTADTQDELLYKTRYADSNICVFDMNGFDIMLHGLV